MKLPKLTLKKGKYRGTDRNGSDLYGPDYYNTQEVKEFVKAAKKLERLYIKGVRNA